MRSVLQAPESVCPVDLTNMGFGAPSAEGDSKPQLFNLGFGAKDAEGGLKPQLVNQCVRANRPHE